MPKCDKSETNQRITEIVQLKLTGHTRSYILEYATEKWAISEHRVDQLIALATQCLKEVNQLTLQDNQAIIVGSLWDLFRQARIENDRPEQHKILMSIAKLKGLDQMTVNHVIEDKRELAEMSDEELDAIIIDTPCPLPPSA